MSAPAFAAGLLSLAATTIVGPATPGGIAGVVGSGVISGGGGGGSGAIGAGGKMCRISTMIAITESMIAMAMRICLPVIRDSGGMELWPVRHCSCREIVWEASEARCRRPPRLTPLMAWKYHLRV